MLRKFGICEKFIFICGKQRVFIVILSSIRQSAVKMHFAGYFLESGAAQNGSYRDSDD